MRETFKKLSVALLILVLAVTFAPGSKVVHAADEELEIHVNETLTIEVDGTNVVYLKFVPEVSGEYQFVSDANYDTYGYLYDSNKAQLTYDDDSAGNRNFCVESVLTAGETYYWGARYYSSGTVGTFDVTLTCVEAYCDHNTKVQEVSVPATCYTDGYIGNVTCMDCPQILEQRQIQTASHVDDDGDGVCESCGKGMPTSSGNCGEYNDSTGGNDDVRYYLYADGELEIYGSGCIAEYAFDYNANITSLNIHEGITGVGSQAFRACDNLARVTFPSTLQKISSYAFYNCDELEEVTIPNGVTSIGYYAFYTESLKKIEIPASVTFTDEYIVSDDTVIWCPLGSFVESYAKEKGYPYVVSDGGDEHNVFSGKLGPKFDWKLDKRTGHLELTGSGAIPSLEGAAAPWNGQKGNITSISLPSGVTEIGSNVFDGLYNLESIHIPSVEDWVGITFNDIPLDTEYTSYAERNLYIGGELAVDVVVPDGITQIPKYAFYGCKSLKSITFPSDLKTIGERAFYKCSSLETVTLPSKLTTIEYYAFGTCSSLKQITIPANVSSLGSSCFYNCTSLESVEFKVNSTNWSKVRTIPGSMFAGTALKEVTVPASVDYINSSAFPGTIEKITVLNPNCSISESCGATFNTAICGFEDSTAEQFASDKSFFFVDYEDEHTHSYKKITSPAHCSRKRCACGQEKIVNHVDKNKDVKCDKCEKSTNAISISKTTSVPLIHEEVVMLSYTPTKAAKFTFKVTGLARYGSSICLYNAANEQIASGWCNENGEAQITRELQKGEQVFLKITNDESVRTVKVSISSHTHTYTEKVTRKATCTMSGWAEYTCSCGEGSYSQSIPSLGHKFATKYTVDKKATATKHGSRSKHCTRDGCNITTSEKTIYRIETIKFSKVKHTYTGKTITPSLVIKDSNGTKLVKDTDYTVKYASGRKSVGKYTATITFKGKYSGTKKLTFYILPQATSKVSSTNTTTTLKATWNKVAAATGYKVELLSSSGKVLQTKHTTKLTTTFSGLTKATTYKIKVTAYKTISDKKQYSIVSKQLTTATKPAAPTSVKATAGSKKATISWKKTTCTGYEIVYSTSSKFSSTKTVTVSSASTVKKAVTGLTKGKTYYFKVRAYKTVGSTKVYSAYSKVVSVKVK